MIAEFHDPDGGFFFTSTSHKHLVVRTKPYQDGAVPSGNATAAIVLLRLSRFLDDVALREKAVEIISNAGELLAVHPEAFAHLICAADFYLDAPLEIVVAGHRNSADTERLLSVVRGSFTPNRIVAFVAPNQHESAGAHRASPIFDGKKMVADAATAYVCRDHACAKPLSDAAALRRLLAGGAQELD
jgi:uncharacterized protein YyaL (SSP411 family)